MRLTKHSQIIFGCIIMFLGACNEEKIPGIEIETPESIANSLEKILFS